MQTVSSVPLPATSAPNCGLRPTSSSFSSDPGRSFCSSWLHKQAQWRIGSWDLRYCQLEGNRMEYRIAKNDAPKKTGTVVSIEPAPVPTEAYSFRVWLLEGGSWTFRAGSADILRMWMTALERAVGGPSAAFSSEARTTVGRDGPAKSNGTIGNGGGTGHPTGDSEGRATALALDAIPPAPTGGEGDPTAEGAIAPLPAFPPYDGTSALAPASFLSSVTTTTTQEPLKAGGGGPPAKTWWIPPPPMDPGRSSASMRHGDAYGGGPSTPPPVPSGTGASYASADPHEVLLTALVEKQGAWTLRWNRRVIELRVGCQLVYRAVNGEARKRFFLVGMDRPPYHFDTHAESLYALLRASSGESFWVHFFTKEESEQWFSTVRKEMRRCVPWHWWDIAPAPTHMPIDPVESRGRDADDIQEVRRGGPVCRSPPSSSSASEMVRTTTTALPRAAAASSSVGGVVLADDTTPGGSGGSRVMVADPAAPPTTKWGGGSGWMKALGRWFDTPQSLLFPHPASTATGTTSSTASLQVQYHAAAIVMLPRSLYCHSIVVFGGSTQYVLPRAVPHVARRASLNGSSSSSSSSKLLSRPVANDTPWRVPMCPFSHLSHACVRLSLRGTLPVQMVDAEPFSELANIKLKPPPLYGATLSPMVMDFSSSPRHRYGESTPFPHDACKEQLCMVLLGGMSGTPQRLPQTEVWGLMVPSTPTMAVRLPRPAFWVRWQVPFPTLPPLAFHTAVPITTVPGGGHAAAPSISPLCLDAMPPHAPSDHPALRTRGHQDPLSMLPTTTTASTSTTSPTRLSTQSLFLAGGVNDRLEPVAATHRLSWHSTGPSDGAKEKVVVVAGPPLPTPRAFHGSVVLKNGVLLVIGGRIPLRPLPVQEAILTLSPAWYSAGVSSSIPSKETNAVPPLAATAEGRIPRAVAAATSSASLPSFLSSSCWQRVRWKENRPLPSLEDVAVSLTPSRDSVVILTDRSYGERRSSVSMPTTPTTPSSPLQPGTTDRRESLSHGTTTSRGVGGAQLFLVHFEWEEEENEKEDIFLPTLPSTTAVLSSSVASSPSEKNTRADAVEGDQPTVVHPDRKHSIHDTITASWVEIPMRMGAIPQRTAGCSIHISDGYVYVLGGAKLSAERLPSLSGPVRALMAESSV